MNQITERYNIVEGFNTIAKGYDLANDAMTFGGHRLWRATLINQAAKLCPKNGTFLDIATGTGDVAIGIAKKRSDIKIFAIDPAAQMLEIAKSKSDLNNIDFRIGNCLKLDFADNSIDLVTISWGIRNVVPFIDGLKEIKRVLKPEGRLLILESGKAKYKISEMLFRAYSKVIPYIGAVISGYKKAYNYYTESADSFPSAENFTRELEKVGYKETTCKVMGLGLIFLYSARK